ncbi:hypothetical protein [Lentzea cavernae]|uniref:hypothetical protein n=1 Tax=Lentzea cavernae TaxID=2020703 RepID=UPI00174DE628|nr:hypothetical protein [Lentzea cavernae]
MISLSARDAASIVTFLGAQMQMGVGVLVPFGFRMNVEQLLPPSLDAGTDH